ncbi:MAG: insulinase family protein [Deltaproteobacteria bacterium HGW-Deltaproteobacteria-4]|nr:MAG: insulinase family protein [Deltaproteobacteria bacterium HGW-Deltaproteobacteria-4]
MKKISYLVCVLSVLLVGCSAPPFRPDQISTPPLHFAVPQIEPIILTNGIRVYLKEDHELPLIQLTVMAPGGAINDPAEKAGLASLLAKSLRTAGTGSRSAEEMDIDLEQLAADFSVSADTYALTFDLSLLASDLVGGLDLLQEVLRTPAFEVERLELARKQTLEAIRRQNDHPQAIASRTLLQAIYGDHPLGRTPTEATVTAISREDLLAAYQGSFSPEKLWIAVSGDFDREQLLAGLEARFASWPAQQPVPQILPPLVDGNAGVVIHGQKDLPQSVVMLGQVGIDKGAPDQHAVRVMNFILGGGGFNSRMMKEIREERGLAYSVYSYFQVGRFLPGPFIAQCETKSSTTIEALKLMLAAMETIREQPVRAEELHIAKESLNNSFVFSFANPHEVVTQAMRLDFYDYPDDYLESYRDKVEALSLTDIQQAARDHLQPEQLSIVLIGNEQGFEASLTTLGFPLVRLATP